LTTAAGDPAQRSAWLSALLDLDDVAREAALRAAETPSEWRRAGARMCALDQVQGILDRDPQTLANALFDTKPPAQPQPGGQAGRYRLERIIGAGGMATVWLARHEDSRLPQQVAVKCLRASLSSPEWNDRFLREQRILARLNHPNVTRLFDAGISTDGTPYIVMELVSGVPITEHCDKVNAGCRERVRLFLKVCDAVAHAHRSLIVHRDLKPRNVLVGEDGEPHLLDFGIAKLLDPDDTEAHNTRTGLSLLTPAYAAPEQFSGESITTATDVYGLGAILHELLTGHRARRLEDGRLQRPSSRVAAQPHATLASRELRRVLRGDLDAILDRALRPEPDQRYASAAALHDELARWIAGQPVLAREGSWRYPTGKFIRRHWLVLGLAAATLVGLSAATAVALHASGRADREARSALAEARRAQAARAFVLELIGDMHPGAALSSPSLLLASAERGIRTRFSADADSRSALLIAVGSLGRAFGELDTSRRMLEDAAEAARRQYGERAPRWMEAEAQLAHTALREGNYVDGQRRLATALATYDTAGGTRGPERIRALANLGRLHQNNGETVAALRLQREAYRAAGASLDSGNPLLLDVLEAFGDALLQAGRHAAAREVLSQSLAAARARYGDQDLAVVSALEALAVCENVRGQPAQAVPLLLEAQATSNALLEGPHVIAAYVENTLGYSRLLLGQPDSARVSFQSALALFGQLLEPPHPMLVATHVNLGEAASERMRFDEAVTAFDEAARQRTALDRSVVFSAIGPQCLASESRARGSSPQAGRDGLLLCIVALRSGPAIDRDYLSSSLAALAEVELRLGDRAAAAKAANEAVSLPSPATAHGRLLPRWVLAQIESRDGDATAVALHARAALAAIEGAVWSRPCETARQLQGMGELLDGVGSRALADQMREARARHACANAS